MSVELTIVMPCLNEAETLETCITKARSFLERSDISGEIVVGDNGSTDGSQEIARKCGARIVHVPIRGYGAALYGAVMAARGMYCIMADADGSYDFNDLMNFVEKLRAGADLIMGNRFLGGIAPGAMPWQNRYIGNPLLTGIGRLLFGCPSRDFCCGIRAFSKEAFYTHGSADDWNGVCVGDGDQSHSIGDENQRDSNNSGFGWAHASASPQTLQRWMEAPQVYDALFSREGFVSVVNGGAIS